MRLAGGTGLRHPLPQPRAGEEQPADLQPVDEELRRQVEAYKTRKQEAASQDGNKRKSSG
jgi:hypothetical protein